MEWFEICLISYGRLMQRYPSVVNSVFKGRENPQIIFEFYVLSCDLKSVKLPKTFGDSGCAFQTDHPIRLNTSCFNCPHICKSISVMSDERVDQCAGNSSCLPHVFLYVLWNVF